MVDNHPAIESEGQGNKLSIRIYDACWREVLSAKSDDDHSSIKIICPFIKDRALDHLLKQSQAKDIQIITRFNLADFHCGVSDLQAIEKLLAIGAKIRGVRNLHAKVYIFGRQRAIVTSANLTWSALTRNSEYGIELTDESNVHSCVKYFDNLWKKSGTDLSLKTVQSWHTQLDLVAETTKKPSRKVLPDYGADIGLLPSSDEINIRFLSASKHYIKFFGTSRNRMPRSTTIIDFLHRSGAHQACTYPTKRKPRRIATGSTMYISVLVDDPNDIVIVGRAIAKAYEDGKDDATKDDLRQREWKGKWARYVRVHDAEFINSELANGVSLNRLMNVRKSKLFASTKKHSIVGEGNTDPRRAYLQKPDVELSEEGAAWVREELQAVFARYGTIGQQDYGHIK